MKKILDLGCGKNKCPNAIGIDRVFLKGVDVIGDVSKSLPFKNAVFDEVIANHLVEHLNEDERISLLKEVHRILKENGVFKIRCPHKFAWRTYEDPTHKALDKLTLKMFDYFEKKSNHSYYFDFHFKIVKKKINEVILFFPFRNLKIFNKHIIWVIVHYTLDNLVKFLANKWELILRLFPIYQIDMYFELEKD